MRGRGGVEHSRRRGPLGSEWFLLVVGAAVPGSCSTSAARGAGETAAAASRPPEAVAGLLLGESGCSPVFLHA
eukprot:1565559-Lingulodinium_polyedra.AAC.1